jgi:hypothetical protein
VRLDAPGSQVAQLVFNRRYRPKGRMQDLSHVSRVPPSEAVLDTRRFFRFNSKFCGWAFQNGTNRFFSRTIRMALWSSLVDSLLSRFIHRTLACVLYVRAKGKRAFSMLMEPALGRPSDTHLILLGACKCDGSRVSFTSPFLDPNNWCSASLSPPCLFRIALLPVSTHAN